MKVNYILRAILIVCCLIFFSHFLATSQSRVNKVIPEFSEKSEKLEEAIGWSQNSTTGKWKEFDQSFEWIQIAKIQYENQLYYVMLYEKEGGQYKYKSIRQGWTSDTRTHFIVMTSKQYFELKKHIELESGKNIEIETRIYNYMNDRYESNSEGHVINDKNLASNVIEAINHNWKNMCFALNSQFVDGQHVVRFLLPREKIVNCDKLETYYYEVSKLDFQKLLID